ncbi:polysaccharide pyruvyl transferase family protein [Agromyces mediolanus]|uniref:polysaccharide pyruvyl transferase family protein n=1 Tax=Agromyces mediolanus TaxID=41986 RepID=UPI003835C9E0
MRILIRGGKPPHVPLAPEPSLARWGWGIFGANVGNTLFLESVYRAVNTPSSEVTVDSLYVELTKRPDEIAAEINERFDLYVIPLANAFRGAFLPSLKRLTAVISRLDIPVVVVGVGGQAEIGSAMSGSDVDEATTEFVRAVLQRSSSVGVRGEDTARYLLSLGFGPDDVPVIGCPSLFDHAGDLVIREDDAELGPESPIAMNITPSAGVEELVRHNTARYPRLTYIPQEHHELAMLLWGTDAAAGHPELPLHTGHPLYQEDRIRFFLDPRTWLGFMREQRFAFGTRIHGTIAALAAGTPGVLLAHDARTLELARYHRIPHRLLADGELDAARLHAAASFDDFNGFMPEAFRRYVYFLSQNGVPNIHQPGEANPEYAELLDAVAFPPGVRTFANESTPFERELLRKLEWLRQGAAEDKNRWRGGYVPEWKPRAS